jgi:hypothetical protein
MSERAIHSVRRKERRTMELLITGVLLGVIVGVMFGMIVNTHPDTLQSSPTVDDNRDFDAICRDNLRLINLNNELQAKLAVAEARSGRMERLCPGWIRLFRMNRRISKCQTICIDAMTVGKSLTIPQRTLRDTPK